jgi:hypothetical protein
MSRLKLKYRESEIQNNLYTFGDEWMTNDNLEYKGLYHRYILTNETYTGGTWDASTSKPLRPLIKLHPNIKTYQELSNQPQATYDAILPIQVTITSADIKNGYINRYFLKKVNEFIFIEISKQQYESYQSKLDNNLYLADTCQWYIVGPIESTMSPIKKPGVIELNTREIQRMEQTLPGISKKLTNPLQFYTDTDFVVPRDINLG